MLGSAATPWQGANQATVNIRCPFCACPPRPAQVAPNPDYKRKNYSPCRLTETRFTGSVTVMRMAGGAAPSPAPPASHAASSSAPISELSPRGMLPPAEGAADAAAALRTAGCAAAAAAGTAVAEGCVCMAPYPLAPPLRPASDSGSSPCGVDAWMAAMYSGGWAAAAWLGWAAGSMGGGAVAACGRPRTTQNSSVGTCGCEPARLLPATQWRNKVNWGSNIGLGCRATLRQLTGWVGPGGSSCRGTSSCRSSCRIPGRLVSSHNAQTEGPCILEKVISLEVQPATKAPGKQAPAVKCGSPHLLIPETQGVQHVLSRHPSADVARCWRLDRLGLGCHLVIKQLGSHALSRTWETNVARHAEVFVRGEGSFCCQRGI